jgi:uncharacterized protein YjbI with pentapeptide repeats
MTQVGSLLGALSDLSPLSWLGVLLIGCVALGSSLLICKSDTRKQLGVGLLTGAVFAAAAYLAQVNFEQRSYMNSLATAGDLPGFDDLGANLNGATLAARNMSNAQLLDARLEAANLAGTSLRSADLTKAHLRDASLFHTRFSEAVLKEADLSQANIRGAKFIDANLGSTIFDGAHADLETCWPLEVIGEDGDPAQVDAGGDALRERLKKAALIPSGVDDRHKLMDATIGHACEADDAEGDADDYRVRVCVDGTILTVPRKGAEADKPDTCELRLAEQKG